MKKWLPALGASAIYSFVFTVFALLLNCAQVAKMERRFRGEYETISVIFARSDIPKGTRIDESMIEIRMIPKKFVQPKAIFNVQDVVGQTSGCSPIFADEQIIATKLALSN